MPSCNTELVCLGSPFVVNFMQIYTTSETEDCFRLAFLYYRYIEMRILTCRRHFKEMVVKHCFNVISQFCRSLSPKRLADRNNNIPKLIHFISTAGLEAGLFSDLVIDVRLYF